MRSIRTWITFVCIALLASLFPVLGRAADVDWSKPETIDAYDTALADFLGFDLGAMQRKAFEAYQAQEYENAARCYLAVVRHNITDANSIYNLACCYGLMGEAQLAAIYLERSYKAGFGDVGHIQNDPDFEKVKGQEVFDKALETIVRMDAEKPKPPGIDIYTRYTKYIHCKVQLPDNYDPQKTYPLLVGLHGWGAEPDSFIRLWERFGEGFEFIYASPEAPYPFMVGDHMGYSWEEGIPENETATRNVREVSEEYVVNAIQDLRTRYKVGDVWLMGFSQGAMMTFSVGLKYHNMFRGIMPFGGWLDEEWIGEEAIEAAKDLPVFIGQGTKDTRVEPEAAYKARDLLAEHGFHVRLFEFDGGHAVPEELTKAAREWMER